MKRPSVKRLFQFPSRTPEAIREEVAEEFQFHLDLRIEALVAAGLSETDARAQARREFGDHRASIDAAVRYQQRVEWRSRVARALDELGQLPRQCRVMSRLLAHNWRLTSVMVLTIAVAVGAATTAMSFVSPILLKALPFHEPDRLYRIDARDARGQPISVSVPTLLDWQRGVRDARLAAYSVLDFNVLGGDTPESVLAARVTPGFFAALDVQASLGQMFTNEEHVSTLLASRSAARVNPAVSMRAE